MRESLEEQILDYLKKMRVGATASELSRKLSINRMTAVKYLEVMRATGLVDYKNVGMAKVYYVSTEFSYAQHVLLLKTRQLLENIKTPEEHHTILENILDSHIEIASTYSKSKREKIANLLEESANKIREAKLSKNNNFKPQ
ncbi:MAG: HTH domain-containing protein [Methanomicrobia archaeon]|jgi:predicted transcriptional regulator|nr:HTH domain-containing protein [Methanomicrobia archaeon]MCK4433087.1 HTH domain-containing protein [Methanomicrobia archaeon]MCK4637309.1 HTH domain-containing protein [Methanomicrobia archaeon]